MGIGCDDAFVVSDTWAQAGVLYPREADRLAWTLKNSLPTILGPATRSHPATHRCQERQVRWRFRV